MRTIWFSVLQWGILTAFHFWALVCFFVIVGELHEDTLTLWFLLLKIMGMLGLYVGYKVARWCYKHGLFPSIYVSVIKDCINEKGQSYE